MIPVATIAEATAPPAAKVTESESISDTDIRLAVERELLLTRGVVADDIDVATALGVVTLEGQTDNLLAKDRSELAFGPVDTELPAYCKEIDAAAVIMGAVSRNLLQRLFVGATAERTLEQLPCDLIIVKPDWYEKSASVDSSQAA